MPELTDTPSVGPTATPGQPDTSEPTATVTPAGGDGYEIGERDDNGETTRKNDKDEQSDDSNGPIWIAAIAGGAVLGRIALGASSKEKAGRGIAGQYVIVQK